METNATSKTTVFEKDHNLIVIEKSSVVMIGGVEKPVKVFVVENSPEMEKFLNQQALIKAATPMVSQTTIDNAVGGLKSLVTSVGGSGGSGKKMMGNIASTIMSIMVSPNPVTIFGGQCDEKIDKSVCSGAMMARIKGELPAVIPSLFMGSFFGGDDDTNAGDGGGSNGGTPSAGQLM